ncbi:MipA/OmpV family protein [Bacteriovoracaceae bacterium]|nr:MipA/OmpV family protein [Bacteriovoracaceae bacterium]
MNTQTLFLSCSFVLTSNLTAQIQSNFNQKIRPLYELGGGLSIFRIPNYPGSKKSTTRTLPFPFAVYRGDFLRSDEEGTRARLLYTEDYETGLSMGFNFPVNSNENDARKGMDDLDAIFEFGPKFLFRFFSDSKYHKLNLSLALRSAFAINLNPEMRFTGFTAEPEISYWRNFDLALPTTLFLSSELKIADAKFNNYFYGVEERDETDSRPRYEATQGPIDLTTSIGLSVEINKKSQVFAGYFYSDYSRSVNKKSPLLERNYNMGFVIGFMSLFYESDEVVDVYRSNKKY